MFGLFTSTRRAQPAYRRSVRLSLENLENRDCPTTGLLDPLVPPAPPPAPVAPIIVVPPATPPAPPPPAPPYVIPIATPPAPPYIIPIVAPPAPAPVTISMTVTYGTEHQLTLQGRVVDPNPAGLTVTFGGVVTGQATTDAGGNFRATFTATSATGGVTATVVGSVPGQTAYTMLAISNTAPVISNFTAVRSSLIWTFSGRVTDEHPAGLTVSFGGGPVSLLGRTAVVEADGWFHLSVQFLNDPADTGMASARIAGDWWGVASNTVFTYVG